MNLTPEQLQSNWNTFINNIEKYITGDRQQQLINFYQEREEDLVLYPASHKDSFHNAFPGGYIDHVNRVVECALKLNKIWQEMGCRTEDYTEEELVFSAINHDLGKIGDKENLMYLQQTDQWRRKNLGEHYKHNSEVDFMSIPDRSLFLLQDYGIKVTQNEYVCIQTHDGLYDDANKKYFISFLPDSKFKSSLPIIIHHADMMAARIEFEQFYYNKEEQPKQEKKPFNLNVKKQSVQNKAISETAKKSTNSNLLNILNDL